MRGTDTPAIAIRGLTCRLGDREVLTGLDLVLQERRIGILGRNGSGKSTLARAMAGLIDTIEGSITIGGDDIRKNRKAALRAVGILFQNPEHQIIFPTGLEEVRFGLAQMGHSKAEATRLAREALARFGRASWAERSTAALSQGQKHLLCVISLLAMEPAVLILDEPFSGLDIPTERALRRVLEDYPGTLVQITHDPQVIAGYDRALWIDDGRVRGDGPPGAVIPDYLAAMTAEGTDAFADL
ncbi:energy-coupling factor ABC transporter ATP-binding protein [Mangrovicoccus sp. HB161399]|uniref:energy-coupling factor ABC transporter ATP-binding protein n=1 Tax=Mangrovicoccus sp. HB161399 TaxID=2720392 RepID=UPI00352CDC35